MTYICNDVLAPDCPDRQACHRGSHPSDRHCWHDSTRRRLEWQHGEARAASITAGSDAEANRDLAAWNRLSRRQDVAA